MPAELDAQQKRVEEVVRRLDRDKDRLLQSVGARHCCPAEACAPVHVRQEHACGAPCRQACLYVLLAVGGSGHVDYGAYRILGMQILGMLKRRVGAGRILSMQITGI